MQRGKVKSKKKLTDAFVRDKDVVFATLVHDTTATIVAEQGMVVLKVAEEPRPYFLPAGSVISYEHYGEDVDITIRNITQEVILELGEDDVYEDELENHPEIMPVDDWPEIKNLMDECKIRELTNSSKTFSTCFAGISLSVVCFILFKLGFKYVLPLYVGMPLGIVLAILFGIRPSIRLFKQLNTPVICDSANNYINLETGETNMNDGMTIPIPR